MHEPYLFVGGPKDGQVLETDGRAHCQFPIYPQRDLISIEDMERHGPVSIASMTVTIASYHGHVYRCPLGRFDELECDTIVYIAEGLPANAVEHLPVMEIWQDLPDWITQRRIALANDLWILGMAFEKSILSVWAVGELGHRWRRR